MTTVTQYLCLSPECNNNDLNQFKTRRINRGRSRGNCDDNRIVECSRCKTLYDYDEFQERVMYIIQHLASAEQSDYNCSFEEDEHPTSPNRCTSLTTHLAPEQNEACSTSMTSVSVNDRTISNERFDTIDTDYELAMILQREEESKTENSKSKSELAKQHHQKSHIQSGGNGDDPNLQLAIAFHIEEEKLAQQSLKSFMAPTQHTHARNNVNEVFDSNDSLAQDSSKLCRDELDSFIETLPCKSCGTTNPELLKLVHGAKWEPPQKFCYRCGTLTGVDDSFSLEECLPMIHDALDKGAIRMPCPAPECDNDDPFEFTFKEQNKKMVIECNKCSHAHAIDSAKVEDERGIFSQVRRMESEKRSRWPRDENYGKPIPGGDGGYRRDTSSSHGDHVRANELFSDALPCQCGNNDEELFNILIDDNEIPYRITCIVCQNSTILDHHLNALHEGTYHRIPDDVASGTQHWTPHDHSNNLPCIHTVNDCPSEDKGTNSGSASWTKTKMSLPEYMLKAEKTYKTLKRLADNAIGKEKLDKTMYAAKDRAKLEGANFLKNAQYAAVKHGQWVGPAISVGVEAYSTYSDIKQKKDERDRGECTQKEYVKFSVTRGVAGGVNAAAGVAGGLIGQTLIPIPVVGSLIGSTVGSVLARGVTSLFH